ncbi:ABC transporter permease [Thiocystis violascens]|uniref:ABC-type antimicrobial peptide transport system, permease component n=1 Tax=Thiocystis violascens (strain ATCC 17096 / DSM 198 / 6111) TaxID=765911 RepID=I3Y7J6_THIV6|nr:ABC transporter permease [Thiocystis violascens]AFL72964.1 ABC-type antimicrobial peptide transport system, permease component [Thiocystis violascens DSM 198]
MRLSDTLDSARRALFAAPSRAGLTLLAMALGTSAVLILSSVGEGARRYVLDQFTGLGTHLLIVIPGRSETTGGPPPLMGETPRDLTLEDAVALLRSRSIARIAPVTIGMAPVSVGSLEREVTILGSTSDFLAVRNLEMAVGRFLPEGDAARARPVAVLGETLAHELFGKVNPVGRTVRIGDRRFRVIGLLAGGGVSLGDDLGDLAVIPVASAQALFDNPALFRILVQASGRHALDAAATDIRDIVRARHEGEDDVTVITQDALLGTFDRILGALTLAVTGIAAISLTVAGVLIMNVMLVAVSQRTEEIGLLKALGAGERQVMGLFLTEALLLAGAGTLLGLMLAQGGIWLFNDRFEAFQLVVPPWATPATTGVALTAGLIFGWLPARRAARLDPIVALSGR